MFDAARFPELLTYPHNSIACFCPAKRLIRRTLQIARSRARAKRQTPLRIGAAADPAIHARNPVVCQELRIQERPGETGKARDGNRKRMVC